MTVQGMKEVEASKFIKEKLDQIDLPIPLVADVHFQPRVGLAAAEIFDKVRVNPGNFADGAKKWDDDAQTERTGAEDGDPAQKDREDRRFDDGHKRIEELLVPLIERCKTFNTALRIGTNHGSLSARILRRYGDTPLGMVESAFEFADICTRENFRNFCFSMKSSNPIVMVNAYRLLASEMLRRGELFPLHLGVTEAGEGEDGRLKSAVGIGSLLQDGIGDTLRVSLTEPPWMEIPVAASIARMQTRKAASPQPAGARRESPGTQETPHANKQGAERLPTREGDREGDGCSPLSAQAGGAGERSEGAEGEQRRSDEERNVSGEIASNAPFRAGSLRSPVPLFKEETRNFESIEKRKLRPLFCARRAHGEKSDETGKERQRILHENGTVMVAVSPEWLEIPEVLYRALGCKVVGGEPLKGITAADSIYVPSLSLASSSPQSPQDADLLLARTARARDALAKLQEAGVGVLVPFQELSYLLMLQRQQEVTQKLRAGSAGSESPTLDAEASREKRVLETSLLPSRKNLVGVMRLRDAAAVRGVLSPYIRERIEGVALLVDGQETEEEIDAVLDMESLLFFLLRPEDRTLQGVPAARRFLDILKRREAKAAQKAREAKAKSLASADAAKEDREDVGGIPVIHWLYRSPPSGVAEKEASPEGQDEEVSSSREFKEERESAIYAGWEAGSLLLDRLGEGVLVDLPALPVQRQVLLGFNLLQACRLRNSKTEFISCPSCGRTLFDIQKVSAEIRARTGHLPGVTVAVMGCIVNGVGEMADADFGYVGGAPGKVDLYVKKKVVKRGIPGSEACDALVELIKQHGKWVDPPTEGSEKETAKQKRT
ncbi:4-hydroxy-3-methylbut-2-en-1-yl diphosphate synthase [Besnoitia besnoiti]|uniref:4-hydroxy-3-methylbut-2-en-1-yl diphosphate synthase n=1 Tax=Besnoitia besnoiti TaxID=94643 RepID=A0A2A9MIU7_BESBE|nr:4-hydroxy-3-methylbut-2-en-1-yl diphosphate synthase [Besnoitia besnoiti]PFH37839.1 4-hydroxy-3-methylbut-2-en-1-yl diphosphate synthase [Besnoitia besnoiti]